MNIDTHDVIAAAESKWNFLKFSPGLVGGHCIGVDPYYLIQKAKVHGIYPRIMSSARRLNDSMGEYIVDSVIKLMNLKGVVVKDAKILVLGVTFKENCPDIRNTKVVDIHNGLKLYTKNITIYDPWAEPKELLAEYGLVSVKELSTNDKYDVLILAVSHREFAHIEIDKVVAPLSVVYDVKGCLDYAFVDGRL